MLPSYSYAQNSDTDTNEPSSPNVSAGTARDAIVGQPLSFDSQVENIGSEIIEEIVWDFGDGTRATGNKVNHTYNKQAEYLVKLKVTTDQNTYEDTTKIHVYQHLVILALDENISANKIEASRLSAADAGILLLPVQAKGGQPEVLVEEDLTSQLLDLRPSISKAHLIIMWTSGGVGANVLTKFAQHIKPTENLPQDSVSFADKGIVLLSETPFGVLTPAAQSAFDQLKPSYVLLTRPELLETLSATNTPEKAKAAVLSSSTDHRLLGEFSARTVSDLGITNFMSFGINYLINRGIPVNSIILILMLPIIATILAFARQVVGIKSFGLITPAMTTLSFLVMGLTYGLIVFIVIVISGTLTRSILRRLRLLYLPRMALVLTSVSLSLLLLLGFGVANNQNSILSFSIFPALILTILAEEFIAAQFKLGVRSALTLTAWTLILSTICYFIVSSEIFRTLILSYPELILVTIPVNIALGQWDGLRMTEYFRFRELLRHAKRLP
jgi:PKD repeat protein